MLRSRAQGLACRVVQCTRGIPKARAVPVAAFSLLRPAFSAPHAPRFWLRTSQRGFLGSSRRAARTAPKVHHERRLVRYKPEQFYSIVADVDNYSKFVPWCQSSTVTKSEGNHMEAELSVGFGILVEKYTSKVTLEPGKSVVATSHDTQLLEYLHTEWKFAPASSPDSCWVTFKVEFKFSSPLYNQVSEMFMQEVVDKMVQAFDNRCKEVYDGQAAAAVV